MLKKKLCVRGVNFVRGDLVFHGFNFAVSLNIFWRSKNTADFLRHSPQSQPQRHSDIGINRRYRAVRSAGVVVATGKIQVTSVTAGDIAAATSVFAWQRGNIYTSRSCESDGNNFQF